VNDIFKFLLDLHKWTRFITIILIFALVFPSLCIIVFFYFEEFMKYNLLNILVLSIIVNSFSLILLYFISLAIRKFFSLILKKDYATIMSKFIQLEEKPTELRNFSKISNFERDIINSSYVLIMLAIGQSLLYAYKAIHLNQGMIQNALSASSLLAIIYEQVKIGGITLGFLTLLYEKYMYSKMENEIKRQQNKTVY